MKESTRIGIIVASVFIMLQLVTLFCVGWAGMSILNYLFTGVWEPMACWLAGAAVFPFLVTLVAFWNLLDDGHADER